MYWSSEGSLARFGSTEDVSILAFSARLGGFVIPMGSILVLGF